MGVEQRKQMDFLHSPLFLFALLETWISSKFPAIVAASGDKNANIL
jgi:hypothetical protein